MTHCANYKICEGNISDEDDNLCEDCKITFGRWERNEGVLIFCEDVVCCRCFTEECEAVLLNDCDHYMCIPCMKESVKVLKFVMPEFPIPEIEELYNDSIEEAQGVLEEEYPVIQAFNTYYRSLIEARAIFNCSRPRINCYICKRDNVGNIEKSYALKRDFSSCDDSDSDA